MAKQPIGRSSRMSFYSPGGEGPYKLGDTSWIEAECFSYPNGGFTRRAYVELRQNPNNPISLPYGEYRMVRCSIPDTYFSIPARLRYRGKTIRGFVSIQDAGGDTARYTFTPEASNG